jgi:hypothetical protein
MGNVPDSAEAVALVLLKLIMERETMQATNQSATAYLLDLYALCLSAVRGERDVSHGPH